VRASERIIELHPAICVLFKKKFMKARNGTTKEEKVENLNISDIKQLRALTSILAPIAAATSYLQASFELTLAHVPHFVIELDRLMSDRRCSNDLEVRMCDGRLVLSCLTPS